MDGEDTKERRKQRDCCWLPKWQFGGEVKKKKLGTVECKRLIDWCHQGNIDLWGSGSVDLFSFKMLQKKKNGHFKAALVLASWHPLAHTSTHAHNSTSTALIIMGKSWLYPMMYFDYALPILRSSFVVYLTPNNQTYNIREWVLYWKVHQSYGYPSCLSFPLLNFVVWRSIFLSWNYYFLNFFLFEFKNNYTVRCHGVYTTGWGYDLAAPSHLISPKRLDC